MLYEPDDIATVDVPIARKPTIGGEKKLWISDEPVIEVGEIAWVTDGSGVYTADQINTIPATGYDLQLKVDGELQSDTSVVVTIVGTDQDDAAVTGTATLSYPKWSSNKTYDYVEGISCDVVPTVSTQKFKTISSISVSGGKKWGKVKLFNLPTAASWQYVDFIRSVEPTIGTYPAHPVPDGLDGAKDVTRGRSDPSGVRVTCNNRGMVDGIQRYAGRQICIRQEIKKQGKVLTERHVFGNVIIAADSNFPDGDEESMQTAAGMMEDAFLFFAK